MHDATEGGLVAALNEMAEASGAGFEVEMEKIPFSREGRIVWENFELSDEEALAMSSTGTILAAVDAQAKVKVEEMLRRNGLSSSLLGKFVKSNERVLVKNGKRTRFPRVSNDPYCKILSAQNIS